MPRHKSAEQHVQAKFVADCHNAGQFPVLDHPELAVAGRSNCGKSSLINALTNRHRLARVSGTPGHTQSLVFYEVSFGGTSFCLVDLPGYGYAKKGKKKKLGWATLISSYLEQRPQLRALLVLCDIRRPPASEEADLFDWAEALHLRCALVLTKADKLSKHQRFSAVQKAKKALDLPFAPLAVSTLESGTIAGLREQTGRILAPRRFSAEPTLSPSTSPTTSPRPLVVGLTGDIGSGKSTVAQALAKLGATVVDADEISREIVAVGSDLLLDLGKAFGERILRPDGALNRQALGQIVFAESNARKKLEALMHPSIVAASERRFDELARGGHDLIIYEAALLVETGRSDNMDHLIVVVTDNRTRRDRIRQRDGLSDEQIQQRISAQLPQRQKASHANFVVDNSGSLDQTSAQVKRLWKTLKSLSSGRVSDGAKR